IEDGGIEVWTSLVADTPQIGAAIWDSLNGILYEDDKMILKIEARKHLNSDTDEVIILVESVE
nr:hypothetical protein [Sulfurovaceae bacterium]